MNRCVRPRPRRGQALVEMCIIFPILLFLVLGVADTGRAFTYQESVTNAARQSLLVAVQSQAAGSTACADFGGVEVGHIPATAGDTLDTGILDAAAFENSSNGTVAGSAIAGSGTTVTVTWHCISSTSVYTNTSAGSTAPTNPTSAAVKVDIVFPFRFLTPLMSTLFPNVQMVAQVWGRAEY